MTLSQAFKPIKGLKIWHVKDGIKKRISRVNFAKETWPFTLGHIKHCAACAKEGKDAYLYGKDHYFVVTR
jgi:hypothetical protein